MKKTILLSSLFATAAAGLGALAADNGVANGVSVESANAVGVLDVSVVAGREQLIAVPFEGYGSGDVKVSDIVKTSGLGEGSKLTAVSRSGSEVNSWTLTDGQWVPAVQVKVSNDGTSSETQGDSPATTTISRGDAFWLNPATSGGTAYVLGQQASGAAAVPTSEGWNIVGNPNVGLTPVSSVLTSPKAGDILVRDVNGNQDRYTYVEGEGSGWSHWVVKGSEKGSYLDLEVVSNLSLKSGEGCWVYVKSAANAGN